MNNGKVTDLYSLDNLVNADIYTGTADKLLQGGAYKIDAETNKIMPILRSKASNVPWIYVRTDSSKECEFWHYIVFEVYGLFPIGCLNCWKVVVRPRTVKELFQLHEYEENVYTGHCKCGIEIRDYVHGNYGGYFYSNSFEEGIECYGIVRKGIDKHISPDVPVILKRACTEFEMKYGDSSKWEEILDKGFYFDKDKNRLSLFSGEALELKLGDVRRNFDLIEKKRKESRGDMPHEGMGNDQPGFVKIATMRKWLEHAYSIGDKTTLEFNENGKPFYTPSVTYHNKKIHDFKKFKKYKEEVIVK